MEKETIHKAFIKREGHYLNYYEQQWKGDECIGQICVPIKSGILPAHTELELSNLKDGESVPVVKKEE